VTIAGYEVELRDLKGAASYAMDCIAVLAKGEEAKSIVDCLIDTPDSYRRVGECEVTLPRH
jgi:hypothetical protein